MAKLLTSTKYACDKCDWSGLVPNIVYKESGDEFKHTEVLLFCPKCNIKFGPRHEIKS